MKDHPVPQEYWMECICVEQMHGYCGWYIPAFNECLHQTIFIMISMVNNSVFLHLPLQPLQASLLQSSPTSLLHQLTCHGKPPNNPMETSLPILCTAALQACFPSLLRMMWVCPLLAMDMPLLYHRIQAALLMSFLSSSGLSTAVGSYSTVSTRQRVT